jgi:hypothetical protein
MNKCIRSFRTLLPNGSKDSKDEGGDLESGFYNQVVEGLVDCGTGINVELTTTCQNAAMAEKCCAGNSPEYVS